MGDRPASAPGGRPFLLELTQEKCMTQCEIDEAVASVTGESVSLIEDRGFGIADPFEVAFDPEPRRPLVLDWDDGSAIYWGEW
jgi:hypothetical protein